MAIIRYPHLFEPIRLGRTLFRNRIFASPISGRSMDAFNRLNNDGIAFYERKAIGGVASVCVGDGLVDSKHGMYGNPGYMLPLDDPLSNRSLNLLSTAVSRHGAVASVELQHCGLYSWGSEANGETVYGPCGGMCARGYEYYEMPEEIILSTIDAFAKAAAWAKQCGFGMVTIHGGHGWLISQFMSSKVNQRKDQWGGSLENRMRFPVAVADAIRRKVGPGFPIEIRISGSEVTASGYDLDEGIAIAKHLDGHVDLIHVSAGHHEDPEVFTVTHPSIFCGDSCNIQFAAAIKQHVDTAVATVGAHCDPELLEEIIASGQADVIEMARALMADPDLPKKARMGRPEEIRPCLRCLTCFSNLVNNSQIYCAVNPTIGRELEHKYTSPAVEKKKVLVAGGGIGGMQAALTAAERGHTVILCEKKDRLGGVLICEESVPFKKKIKDYLAWLVRQVERAPIDVRLNTPVTPEIAGELSPDVIIAALGARAVIPPIPGIDGKTVISAEAAYDNPETVGDKVVVLGGGLVGVELALFLAGTGREITIVEMLPELNHGGNFLHQFALDVELKKKRIKLSLSTAAAMITEKGIIGKNAEGELFFAADTVIYAIGQSPLSEEVDALRFCALEFYTIGDCVIAKNILQATSMADAIARNI